MRKILIWALESEYDAEAIFYLAESYLKQNNSENVYINKSGNRALPKKKENGLLLATKNYLREYDKVIFVIDYDGPMSSHERKRQPNSLINQVHRITKDKEIGQLTSCVFAVCELEAWLLIDCIGIMCYFVNQYYRKMNRDQIISNRRYMRMIRQNQIGKTDLIVEPESGGRGAKEHLISYSKNILREINPNKSNRNLNSEAYCENLSPQIAKFIEISPQSINRNDSFKLFGNLLK